jgi:hypothetical protein
MMRNEKSVYVTRFDSFNSKDFPNGTIYRSVFADGLEVSSYKIK